MAENIGGIPVLDIGVPVKKDRGDLYAKSLQEVVDLVEPRKGKESVGGSQFRTKADQTNQKESPIDTFYEDFQREQDKEYRGLKNPNPRKDISPELQKEINSHLSATEKQSLEYLRLKALNVQTAIERVKGEHNSKRGALTVETKGKGKWEYSLTSFGQTTQFHYVAGVQKTGFDSSQQEDAFYEQKAKEGYRSLFGYYTLVTPGFDRLPIFSSPEGAIQFMNFINFSKDFIKNNIRTIPLQAKSEKGNPDWPFYNKNDGIECHNKAAMDGSTKILKSESSFFPKFATKEVIDYLNHLYKEEIVNQKIVQPKDADGFTPFPPK